jgi:dephospho-CoA kinase
VVDASGGLDRRKLGAIVFADAGERKALEAIVHPEVVRASNDWFAALDPSHPFAVADIPLLYETGRDRAFDAVVVTACDPEEQVRRVMRRDGLPEADARQRIAAQLPIGEKVRRGDYVIRTDGSFAETDAQVRQVALAIGNL